jgi:Carboxypeptidase regulatory-like domain
MTSRSWMTLIVLSMSLFASERAALACSCAMSGPPCQATWRSDVVFAGTVISMAPIEVVSAGFRHQSMQVAFNVEQRFLNAPAGRIEVVTGMGGGDCGYRFTVGMKYLVYANKNEESSRLTTGICSRTRPLAEAKDDLQYLTTIGAKGTGGHLYGRINEWRRDPAEERGVDYGPVEGITVSVRGRTFGRDVTTNADGRFDIPGLPVGKFKLTVVPPFGFEPNPFEREIEITDPRACSLVDLTIEALARASGVVVDSSGRPLAGVSVEAVAAELAGFDPPSYHSPVTTNDNGVFEFQRLPPGSYVFGVYLTKSPYIRDRSERAIFVPGTRAASDAAVFDLKAGDRKDVGTLRLVR